MLLRLGGAGYNFVQVMGSKNQDRNRETKVILCIGESTTHWGMQESYPAQLQLRLDKTAGPGKFLVINEGQAATNSKAIVEKLQEKFEKYKPDYVITMVGINDVWALTDSATVLDNFKLFKFAKLVIHNFPELKKIFVEKLGERMQRSNHGEALSTANVSAEDAKIDIEIIQRLNDSDRASQERNYEFVVKTVDQLEKMGTLRAEHEMRIGMLLLEQGVQTRAVDHFRKYAKSRNNIHAYKEVANIFFIKYGPHDVFGKTVTRDFLTQALLFDKNDVESLELLGFSLSQDPDNDELSLKYLTRAFELGSRQFNVILGLAAVFERKNDRTSANNYLKLGLEQGDGSIWVWIRLIENYLQAKNYVEADEYIGKAYNYLGRNQRIVDLNLRSFQAQGKNVENLKVYTVRNFHEFPPTRENYTRIAELAESAKVNLIVMQYPRRSIQPLKELLQKYPRTLFVENLNNFETTLKIKTYDDLFIDKFGDDFGHFTLLSSNLIVDNIVDILTQSGALNFK